MIFAKPRQAVILVGGLGTRLGALTKATPKPLLEVGGRPFLDLLVREAHRFGCSDILMLAGFRADLIQKFAIAHPLAAHIRLSVVIEAQPLGTAGALRQAAPLLNETFFLLNGDSWFDCNWYQLTTAGRTVADCLAAMLVRPVSDASRFGVVDVKAEKITGFRPSGEPQGGLINAGVYLMRREILASLGEASSLEHEVLPAMAAAGRLVARPSQGYFIDVGVPSSLAEAQRVLPRARCRPAVFFDRDGVLNRDVGYVHRPEDFHWIENARQAIAEVNDSGFHAFVVSNQAGVARGYYGLDEIAELQSYMEAELHAAGAFIDDFRYCPHHPAGTISEFAIACECRKPKAGMLESLIDKWQVRRDMSFLIGDKNTDLRAARAAGVHAYRFDGGDLLRFLQTCSDWENRRTLRARVDGS